MVSRFEAAAERHGVEQQQMLDLLGMRSQDRWRRRRSGALRAMQRCAATPLADLWVGAVFSSSLRLPWLLPGAVPHEHRVLACLRSTLMTAGS